MNKVRSIAKLVIVFSLIAGCAKDHALPTENDCYNFVLPSSGIGPLYGEGRYQFKAPCFNPNNVNEFCYLFIDNQTGDYKLCSFNLLTKTKTDILDGYQIILQPKWSTNDWIYFNILDRTVWKIKSNGDSLMELTKNGADLYPEPNYNGTEITMAHIYEGATQEPSIQYIVNQQGDVIDSLNYSDFGLGAGIIISWSSNNQWAFSLGSSSSYGIGVFNVTSKSLDQINTWGFNNGKDEIQDIKWNTNSEEIYYTKWNNGLFKVNVTDSKEIQIKEGCDSKSYAFISISLDAKLLTERVSATFVNPVITRDSRIYLMNTDGSDEHEIALPIN